MIIRWLFSALAPAGEQSRLSIFMFHRVRSVPDPLFPGDPDATRFEQQMRWVRQWFHVLPLPEAVRRLEQGSLPACPAAITFDDGYADNFTAALPILQRLGLTATVFVATGFLDGGRMWNDVVIDSVRHTSLPRLRLPELGHPELPVETVEQKRAAIELLLPKLKYLPAEERREQTEAVREAARMELPGDIMMTTAQVRAMHAAGITIGAHTVSHPILTRIDSARARCEIEDSRAAVKAITGEDVALFAYPNGKPGKDYAAEHVEMVRRAGFQAAFSTSSGAARRSSDLFQLPRFTPWDRSAPRWAYRLAANLRHTEPSVAAAITPG